MNREDEPTRRVHIHIFESDHDWIMTNYNASIGMSKFIRLVLRRYRRKLEAKAESEARALPRAEEL